MNFIANSPQNSNSLLTFLENQIRSKKELNKVGIELNTTKLKVSELEQQLYSKIKEEEYIKILFPNAFRKPLIDSEIKTIDGADGTEFKVISYYEDILGRLNWKRLGQYAGKWLQVLDACRVDKKNDRVYITKKGAFILKLYCIPWSGEDFSI